MIRFLGLKTLNNRRLGPEDLIVRVLGCSGAGIICRVPGVQVMERVFGEASLPAVTVQASIINNILLSYAKCSYSSR